MDAGPGDSRGHRSIWLVATACVLIAAGFWALARRHATPPSSYATGPAGMAGLYRLLGQEGVTVGRRTSGTLQAGILVGAVGTVQPSAADVEALLQWVRAGNEAILLGPVPAAGLALGVTGAAPPFGEAAAKAALALPELRGADTLRLPQGTLLLPTGGPARRAATLYTVLGQPAVLDLGFGQGRIYWIGSASAWSNATLARWPGNLALAEGLLDGPRPVWFDEYWFGRGMAPAEKVAQAQGTARPPLPRDADVVLAALALAAASAIWAAGWRRHPVRRDPPPAPGASEPVLAYAEWLSRTGAPGADGDTGGQKGEVRDA